MIKTEKLKLDNKKLQGLIAELPNAPLIVIISLRGYRTCGHLNMGFAEKLGQAAAIVGIKNIDEILNG